MRITIYEDYSDFHTIVCFTDGDPQSLSTMLAERHPFANQVRVKELVNPYFEQSSRSVFVRLGLFSLQGDLSLCSVVGTYILLAP